MEAGKPQKDDSLYLLRNYLRRERGFRMTFRNVTK
jgi:hypothetical protein